MKTWLSVLAALFFIFVVVTISGLYPVAVAGKSLVFSRTWKKSERAAENFINSQIFIRSGGKLIDFSSSQNADLLLEIRRNTLTFLIEDAIIRQKGKGIISNLEKLSEERLNEILSNQPNVQTAMETAYGIPFREVRNLVLFPQTRRDILRESLAKENQNFEEWLKQQKKSIKVLLFMTSFKWNGEQVE